MNLLAQRVARSSAVAELLVVRSSRLKVAMLARHIFLIVSHQKFSRCKYQNAVPAARGFTANTHDVQRTSHAVLQRLI